MTWDGTLETGQDPEHDDEDPGGEENHGLARDAGHQADQQTSWKQEIKSGGNV